MNLHDALLNKDTLPYRQGVIGLVRNKENKILLVQMIGYKDNEWRFPGGGIDEGEDVSVALLRELFEELRSDKFEIVAESAHKIEYGWPDEVIKERYESKKELYRGQQQYQFLVRFNGESNDLQPDPNELKSIKWVSVGELETHLIFPGQMEEVRKVLDEFKVA